MSARPKNSLLKTSLKALWPALLLAQPAFASVRSSSVSRAQSRTAAMALPGSESSSNKELENAETQSNPFAAFGGSAEPEQMMPIEPAAETLAFLAEQGLLVPGAELLATESGQNFNSRKEFAAFPSPGGFAVCNNPSRPSNYDSVSWGPNGGVQGAVCQVFSGNNVIRVRDGNNPDYAQCKIWHDVCVASSNSAPTNISLTANTLNQSATANTVIGTLSSTDANSGDTHTYSLIAGAGDTDNASFNISVNSLRATNPGAIAAGNRTVRIRTTDSGSGNRTFDKIFTIVVSDNVAPTVTNVTSSASNGKFKAGDTVPIQVTFSEAVTVTGSPTLTLETGATDSDAVYLSGSTTTTLNFNYTVQAGDSSADLDYFATTALQGTIKDAASNSATLTLPGVGAAGSLGANKNLTIDGIAPTVTISSNKTALKSGEFATITFAFSEAVSGFTPADVSLGAASGSLTNFSVNGNNYTATYTPANNGTATIGIAAGTFYDSANNTNAVAATSLTIEVDSTAPTVSSIARQTPSVELTAADSLTWRVTFDETVTGVDATDFALTGPTGASLSVSGSGTVYDITASAGDLASYSGVASLSFAGGQNITDSAGNALTATTPSGTSQLSYTLDNAGPVISAVSIANTAMKIGDVVTVTITVGSDTDTYSLVSGTVAGFTLSGLTKVNNTTYTASFTVTAGSDVAAGTNIPVSLTLADSLANNSSPYNTAISQNADAIDATRPTVSSVSRENPTEEDTNADQLVWTLIFSEVVNGLSAADLVIAGSTATVTNLTSSDNRIYSATVSGGDLAGLTSEVYIKLATGYSVTDVAGNAMTVAATPAFLPGSGFYVDNTAPLAPLNLGLEVASDCGVSSTDRKTNDNTPAVLGQLVNSGDQIASISIYGSSNELLGTTTEHDCGAWGITSSVLTDGTHQLTAKATDFAGNVSVASTALEILIDTVVPTASVTASAVTSANDGQGSYSFTVTYADASSGVDTASFDGSDIRVSGPNLYDVAASFVSASGNVATYSITPPGSSWNSGDAGTYVVSLATEQVRDIAGNFAAANSSLGSFTVSFNAAPVNTVTPVLSATPAIGTSFSATNGTWTDTENDNLTYSYQWYRADNGAGSNEVLISAATTSSYTPVQADAHKYLRVKVSADDGNNTAVAAYSSYSAVSNSIPQNTVVPAISGTATVGNALTGSAGTWTDADGDSPTYSYQWYRATDSSGTGAVAISGAVSASYTLTTADAHRYLRVVVTANDGNGSADQTATSTYTAIGNAAPVNTVVPAISGTATVGNALTGSAGTWTDADGDSPTYSYQWYRATDSSGTGAVAISGAVSASYTLTTADAHRYLRVVVTANDGNGSTNQTASSVYTAVTNSTPQISGTPTLTATEDVAYSFAPAASDVDSDTLIYSIANKPTWASFNTATGALTGTPANADVGATADIVISVSDGTLSAALPAFTLTVSNVNDAPTISGTPAVTVAQDVAYSFTPTAADVDTGTTLIYSIANKPAWASFNTATGALTGTPANADVGATADIVISVSDGTLSAALSAFTLTVTNVNDAPTISGTPAVTVAQGGAYSFTPTAADVDTGTTLIYSIANKPAWASFNTATGVLSGAPTNADVGATANIVISVSDGTLSAALPAFTLTVTNVNDAPTITGSPATTVAQDVAYSFTPTAADVDTGTVLTYSIANKPAWASFDTATGVLSGTPTNTDVGTTAGIVISVSDGTETAALPAFALTVSNVNDAPTITGSPATTVAQDVAYSFIPTAADVDTGTVLTYSIANKPAWASFDTATGVLSGTPTNADVGTTAGIVISVSDGTETATLPAFTLTVTNVNDAPTITGSPATTVAQDVAYSFIPTAADVDTGTALTYSIANKPSWASFDTATGVLSGTPTNADVGTTTGIVISVSDGTETVALPAFALTVTNVNDAPTITGSPATTVAQDVAYSFIPTAADVDTGTVLTYSIANKPAWASFDTATGVLSGTPTNTDVGTTAGIVISVSDGTETATLPAFALTVTNVNDAPTITGSPATTVAQDVAYSFIPTAADVDTGTVLTYSIANKPSWATFNTATGALTGTPTNADVGTTADIVISVSDGTETVALPAFTLTVSNVNDAPTITGTPATTVAQDVAYSFTPTAADVDTGAVLTYSIANKPAWATFNTATGALTGTPTNADVGTTAGIVISVSDGTETVALPAFALTVSNVNDAPTVSSVAVTQASEDVAYSYSFAVSDVDAQDQLTLSAPTLPAWINFNTVTGVLSGTPGNAEVGSHTVVLRATDAEGLFVEQSFTIVVTNINDAPVISGAPATTVAQDVAYSFTPTATDVDTGTVLTYSIANKPAWATFNTATGALTGTPTNADVGATAGIVISVSDGIETAALPAFTLTVTNVNDAPTITGSPATTVAQGAAYSFVPTAADVDTGTVLTYSIANKPTWASFNPASGALSGTPVNADVGATAGIVISVSDGELSAALPAFTLTVTNVNDAPTITGSPATTVAQGAAYSFIPTATDVDTGTVLTYSIANKPTWATFNTATGALTGTPANTDVGATVGVVISVSDGALSAALPAFTLTVTNVNDAPTITGSPAVTVAQGASYSFVPTAADVDAETTLTFSIANKPGWASFNTATGALTGTPANADVGVTAGVVISVSDGALSAALPAFTLTVTNTNDVPVAADSSATTAEDTPLSLNLTAQDADQDQLTYEIVSQPQHGTVTLQGALLVYTPEPNFNGADSVGFVANDAESGSNTATISLTVTAVNDNPVVEDDSYNLQRTDNNQYQLAVLANDRDVDEDTLTIDGASTTVGTVIFNEQGLTLTAPDRYVGPVSLRYTVTDGKGGRDNADVTLIIEGGVASNLPVITVPADIEVNATALFTRVPLGTATAVDRNGRRLRVSLINGSLFFSPGEHIVYWQATDADGNTATKAQKVSVNPLVSLSKDQQVTEGREVNVEVILNGPAPVYPVLVPYTVSGSADGNDHTLVSGVAEISSGLSTTLRFNVLEDAQLDSPEDIVITLDSSVNRGSQRSSRILISDANIAPVVTLTVQQNSENRLTVAEGDGLVSVTATVTDANSQDQVTGVWDLGRLTNVTSDQTQLSFDPAEQGPGLYQISYTATDNGTPNLSSTTRVFIVVRPSLPALGTQDTDGDLVPDDQEGFADADGDGIPDYQDAIAECNVMPTELLGQTEFVAEGDPGVCLRLGTVAAETNAGGLQIAKDAIEVDDVAVNIGGIFDFIAYGLPEQGKSYSLVIPQRLPVPINAVYRKFNDVTGWVDFVSNERNSVSSTAGERGYCPPPGGAEWTAGLTEGHWCVQVTVEDGGPNDADGIANSAIVDPGGVAVELNGNSLPVALADQASVRADTAVDVNVLANDTDVDGDALTVSQANSSFGTVTILANQHLSYTPNPDFVGIDTVIYSITDGKGGTASSELVVNVFSNNAPTAVNDTASTDDRTAIRIAVLSNDTDADGDVLTVSAASALQGSVIIEADQRLRYTPKAGFDGVDTISYTVIDSSGDTATASVSVTVRAYQNVVVDNKSSGGSMTWWMGMVLAGAVMVRRRSVFGFVTVALLSFSPFSQGEDWYLQGSVGQSKADQKQSRLVEELPSGTITAFDDSDTLYGITLGYQLHPYFALEMGYQDSGEASSQISGDSLTPEQYHELVKAVSPVLVDGWTVAARFTLWQNEQWDLEVPLGILNWDSEIESTMDDTTLYTERDGNDWFLGVQLNYQVAEDWKLGLGYQQLELDANDVSSWLLSARYDF